MQGVIEDFQTADANRVYAPLGNRMYSLATGEVVWSSGAISDVSGAVTGSDVVFSSGSSVRMEPY